MVKKGAPSLCTSPIQRSIFNHGDTSLPPSPLIYHALTIFFSTDAAILMRSSHRNGDAKRTVRINCFFAILQLSRSTFFQLNRCISSHRAIHDISAHRRIFAPPSLWRARVYWNKAAMQKERWETIWFWRLYSFFIRHFFHLNCYFWGDCMIWDIYAHRRIFAPKPPWLARVYYNRAAMPKEWLEIIGFWCLYSSFTHHFFN